MQKARVFISCGQEDIEKDYGLKAADFFREKGFEPYFAEEIQTPEGLTQNIFNSLKRSEYFICINPERKKGEIGSIFIQQEFAIAAFLEIPMLAFHIGNVKPAGIGKYLILKSIKISSIQELLEKLRSLTQTWNAQSRNQLKLSFGNFHSNILIVDQPNAPLSNWFHIIVENESKHLYCKNCFAYVEKVTNTTGRADIISNNDYKEELIWAGTSDISVNIPEQGKRDVDAFYWIQGSQVIQFHQRSSSTVYRYPNLTSYGKYQLIFDIISDNFPAAKIVAAIEFSSTGIAVLSSKQIL